MTYFMILLGSFLFAQEDVKQEMQQAQQEVEATAQQAEQKVKQEMSEEERKRQSERACHVNSLTDAIPAQVFFQQKISEGSGEMEIQQEIQSDEIKLVATINPQEQTDKVDADGVQLTAEVPVMGNVQGDSLSFVKGEVNGTIVEEPTVNFNAEKKTATIQAKLSPSEEQTNGRVELTGVLKYKTVVKASEVDQPILSSEQLAYKAHLDVGTATIDAEEEGANYISWINRPEVVVIKGEDGCIWYRGEVGDGQPEGFFSSFFGSKGKEQTHLVVNGKLAKIEPAFFELEKGETDEKKTDKLLIFVEEQ